MSLHFRKQKKRLNKHLIQFSNTIEKQVGYAIQSVSDLDKRLAKRVIKADLMIDQSEIEMEEDCLKLLALYQPVANDLRLLVSVLKINNDLERIGDHAVIIAEKAIELSELDKIDIPSELFELAAQAKMMLRKVLLAFVESDIQVAEDVILLRQTVQALTQSIYDEQLRLIKDNVDEVEQRLHILTISKQVQRIADHATNISEDIIFFMRGEIVRHSKEYSEE